MKRILVISDNHGDYYTMNDVINKEKDVDIYIHLGDSNLPSYLLTSFLGVKGNCDYSLEFPLTRDIEVNNIKIHMEHGNSFRLSYDLDNYLNDLKCDIFLFGHTHRKLDYKYNNTLLLNPGSLTRPRDSNKGSYLIIDILDNKEINYIFKEVDL